MRVALVGCFDIGLVRINFPLGQGLLLDVLHDEPARTAAAAPPALLTPS